MTIRRKRSGSPAVGTPPPVLSAPRPLSPLAGPLPRYIVERCPGRGDCVEVVDLTRKPLSRVVARTSWTDAHMIADALNWRDRMREVGQSLQTALLDHVLDDRQSK